MVWRFKLDPKTRGPLGWRKRLQKESVKNQLDERLMVRDEHYRKIMYHYGLEKKFETQHIIAAAKIEQFHDGISGPTAGGPWWQQWQLARHFDDHFEEKFQQADELLDEMLDEHRELKDEVERLIYNSIPEDQEMEHFEPGEGHDFIDRADAKRKG